MSEENQREIGVTKANGRQCFKNYANNFDKWDQMRTEHLPLYLAM